MNPFKTAAVLAVLAGLASHFWGAWYVPVIAVIMILFLVGDDYFVNKLLGAALMTAAVAGFYQFPFVGADTQQVLGGAASAFLVFFFFGRIIADYFNQKGAFAT